MQIVKTFVAVSALWAYAQISRNDNECAPSEVDAGPAGRYAGPVISSVRAS